MLATTPSAVGPSTEGGPQLGPVQARLSALCLRMERETEQSIFSLAMQGIGDCLKNKCPRLWQRILK